MASFFDPPQNWRIKYINPKLDFEIDPDHFIKWLKVEMGEDDVKEDDYKFSVGDMCEYSCLYVSLLFDGVELDGELRVVGGNFGFWGHYWMEYHVDGQKYIIDLTLMQFRPDAPKLSIVEWVNEDVNGCYYNIDLTTMSISEYLDGKREYYTCVKTLKPSKYNVNNPFHNDNYMNIFGGFDHLSGRINEFLT